MNKLNKDDQDVQDVQDEPGGSVFRIRGTVRVFVFRFFKVPGYFQGGSSLADQKKRSIGYFQVGTF